MTPGRTAEAGNAHLMFALGLPALTRPPPHPPRGPPRGPIRDCVRLPPVSRTPSRGG